MGVMGRKETHLHDVDLSNEARLSGARKMLRCRATNVAGADGRLCDVPYRNAAIRAARDQKVLLLLLLLWPACCIPVCEMRARLCGRWHGRMGCVGGSGCCGGALQVGQGQHGAAMVVHLRG